MVNNNLAELLGRSCSLMLSSGGCSHRSRSSSRVEWALSRASEENWENSHFPSPLTTRHSALERERTFQFVLSLLTWENKSSVRVYQELQRSLRYDLNHDKTRLQPLTRSLSTRWEHHLPNCSALYLNSRSLSPFLSLELHTHSYNFFGWRTACEVKGCRECMYFQKA